MSNDTRRFFVDRFSRGDRLSASQVNAIVDGLVSAIQSDTILASRTGNNLLLDAVDPPRHQDHFLAKITGNSAVTANVKWKYAWSEIIMSSDAAAAKSGARSGTTSTGYALNIVELNNTTAGAIGGDGVNSAGADYPAGFKRRPIGSQGTTDTHANDVIVMMFVVVNKDSGRNYLFSQPNAHDGTCAA